MDVALEEIVNAMMTVCGSKSNEHSLHRRTHAVFNQKRLTTPTGNDSTLAFTSGFNPVS